LIVVITGANGFLGSHLLEQSIKRGNHTIGIVRPSADRSNITCNCEIVETDYSKASLQYLFKMLKAKYGPIDLCIHNAGATRAKTNKGFTEINAGITQELINTIQKEEFLLPNGKFIYISSMAAKGPVGASGPVSQYGASKLSAEKIVKNSKIPFNIFRPTAIYGPRDVQFLRLVKTVKKRIYPSVAPHQKITMIHAEDAASNILRLSISKENQTIPLEDGAVYSHEQMRTAISQGLGVSCLNIKIPRSLATFFIAIEESLAKILGIHPSMTVEKFREITQDWDHERDQFEKYGLEIKYDIYTGMKDAINYYRKHKLI